MLRVGIDELVEEVRITLDENASQSQYLNLNKDNLELDEIIRRKLLEAARDITESSPVNKLEPEVMETEVTTNEYGGYLTIPEDFLRLVSLKMKGWKRSVTVVADEGSDIDLMQRNPFVKGHNIKPMCVFSHNDSGNRVLEYFGKSNEVEKALYMPIPTIEPNENSDIIKISRLLRKDIVRRAAGLVLLSRGEVEFANQFLA